MNVPVTIGLIATIVFNIGILVGTGLNGRAQIARDKWHAEIRREINNRLRAVTIASRIASNQQNKRGK